MAAAAADCKKRIAVIAVHGVADQQPAESARAVANLLLNIEPQKAVYAPFEATTIHVPTRPVQLLEGSPQVGRPALRDANAPAMSRSDRSQQTKKALDEGDTRGAARLSSSFHELTQSDCQRATRRGRAGGEARHADGMPAVAEGAGESGIEGAEDYHLMLSFLTDYHGEGPGSTYETVRLAGERRPANGDPGARVDVYEMYWADLSRLGTGVIQILSEVYQLILHVSSLGTHTIDAALPEHAPRKAWQQYASVQRWASLTLQIHVALIELMILGIAVVLGVVGAFAKLSTPAVRAGVVWCVMLVVATGVCGFLLTRARKVHSVFWVAPPIVLLAGVPLVIGAVARAREHAVSPMFTWIGTFNVIAAAATVAAGLLIALLVDRYRRRRPGAGRWGVAYGIAVAGVFIIELCLSANTAEGVVSACFSTLEYGCAALGVALMAFVLLQAVAAVFGGVLGGRAATPEGRRVRRAAWTARLTLALPPCCSCSPRWASRWCCTSRSARSSGRSRTRHGSSR